MRVNSIIIAILSFLLISMIVSFVFQSNKNQRLVNKNNILTKENESLVKGYNDYYRLLIRKEVYHEAIDRAIYGIRYLMSRTAVDDVFCTIGEHDQVEINFYISTIYIYEQELKELGEQPENIEVKMKKEIEFSINECKKSEYHRRYLQKIKEQNQTGEQAN